MRRQDVAWLAFWAGFGVLDYTAAQRGKALCHSVCYLFRTDTPAGRARFTAAYVTGAYVLRRHILG